MEKSVLFNTAKELAKKINLVKTCYRGLEAAVIICEDETYLGVTGVNVRNGKIIDVPADVAAFLNMKNSGGKTAKGLAVIKLEDLTLSKPSEEALELLFRAGIGNDGCLVCLGAGETKLLSELRLGTDSGSLMDGFDGFDEPSGKEMPAPDTTANVISGVAVEESSPFYEKEEEVAPPDETLSVMSEEQKADAMKSTPVDPELTPEELLKQAKKRKNVAKSNFLFRKKHH